MKARYTTFPLHPETPDAGMNLHELFAGRMDVNSMLKHLRQVAEELNLPFGERTHTYNSRRAQELGKWAEQQGQGDKFQDAIYRAYFVDGKNIGRTEVLMEIAATIGLDRNEAERVLQDRRHAADVNADWERARILDVTAVPTLIYGNRRLVGFHPYEDYRKLIIG